MSQKFSGFFLPKLKKKNQKSKTVFYIEAFDMIEVQTCLAPQNDHRNLSFVKDIYVVGNKMTRNGCKIAKVKGCLSYIEMEYTISYGKNRESGKILFKIWSNSNQLQMFSKKYSCNNSTQGLLDLVVLAQLQP